MAKMHYREVWEREVGCRVPPSWHVHHVDGNHRNDAPSNLVAMPPGCHAKVHEATWASVKALTVRRECLWCARSFVSSRTARYCSPRCRHRYSAALARERYRRGLRCYQCVTCGHGGIGPEGRRFCSPVCEVRESVRLDRAARKRAPLEDQGQDHSYEASSDHEGLAGHR